MGAAETTLEDVVIPAQTGFWRGKTVLVTGGSGFVGRTLASELRRRGTRVIGWSRRVEPAWRAADDAPDWVQGELTDRATLDAVCDEVDAVFHLAAASLQAASSPEVFASANVEGTRHVAEAAARAAKRPVFVLASTDRVYAPSAPLPRIETSEVDPVGDYAASKAAAEEVVMHSFRSLHLRGAILRLSNVYGPGDSHRSRVVPGIMAAVAAGRAPRLRSDGSARRDFLFVEDAASAFLTAAEAALRREHLSEIYNVGSGEPTSTLQLAQLALLVAGRSDLSVEIDATTRDSSSWLDCTKIERDLGWSAAVKLRDGLQRTYASLA